MLRFTPIYLAIFINTLYIHRLALINHYLQHYYPTNIIYKIISIFLLLEGSAREMHMKHHSKFNTKEDPDYLIYNPNIPIKQHLFKLATLQYLLKKREQKKYIIREEILKIMLALVLVFIFYILYGKIYYYFLLILLPIIFAKIINDFRVFAEHYDPIKKTGALKQLKGLPFLNYFISSYGFDTHDKHHIKPSRHEIGVDKTSWIDNHLVEIFRAIKNDK